MSKKRHRGKAESQRPKDLENMNLQAKPSETMKTIREQAKRITAEEGIIGSIDKILEQAKKLACEARETEPNITRIYWFPNDREVRLIETDAGTIKSLSGSVEPFYWDSTADIPVPSGIAIIRPDEFGELQLPDGWGSWEDGREL